MKSEFLEVSGVCFRFLFRDSIPKFFMMEGAAFRIRTAVSTLGVPLNGIGVAAGGLTLEDFNL